MPKIREKRSPVFVKKSAEEEPTDFRKELEILLNRCCCENVSDTPDFILAEFLLRALDTWNFMTQERDRWHGFDPFAQIQKKADSKSRFGIIEGIGEVRPCSDCGVLIVAGASPQCMRCVDEMIASKEEKGT